MVLNKYVMKALTRKGSKQEKVVLLLNFLGVRGWRHLRRELLWWHVAPSEVQELGRRDVNLDAAIDFTEKGLHILVNKGADQVPVQHWYSKIEHALPTEIRLKDQRGAIVPFEDLEDRQQHERRSMRGVFGQMSCAHFDARRTR